MVSRSRLSCDTVSQQHISLTVFNLAYIADDDISDGYLLHLAEPDHRELVLALNLTLQASKLLLLPPVVERRHENDDNHGAKNGHALNPAGMVRAFLLCNSASQQYGQRLPI